MDDDTNIFGSKKGGNVFGGSSSAFTQSQAGFNLSIASATAPVTATQSTFGVSSGADVGATDQIVKVKKVHDSMKKTGFADPAAHVHKNAPRWLDYNNPAPTLDQYNLAIKKPYKSISFGADSKYYGLPMKLIELVGQDTEEMARSEYHGSYPSNKTKKNIQNKISSLVAIIKDYELLIGAEATWRVHVLWFYSSFPRSFPPPVGF